MSFGVLANPQPKIVEPLKPVPAIDRIAACDLVGESAAIKSLRAFVARVARSKAPIILLGPSGSGKEAVARAIHRQSDNADKPYLAINAAALPEALIEAELFGHERGAFTGATAIRIGKFEAVSNGTLMLDELGDMSLDAQTKLLRVLEDGTFCRVGSNDPRQFNGRLIAATHRDLDAMMAEGRFREDLFWRLNVLRVEIPPLAARREDILPLLRHFLALENGAVNLTDGARASLLSHSWPGNAREVRNLTARILAWDIHELDSCQMAELLERPCPTRGSSYRATNRIPQEAILDDLCDRLFDTMEQSGLGLHQLEDQIGSRIVRRALSESHGVMAQGARRLGISRTSLIERHKKYNGTIRIEYSNEL